MNSSVSARKITKENRHQYYDTTVVTESDAHREITQAEARGRERQTADEAFKQTLKRTALLVATITFCAVIGAFIWKILPH